MVNEFKILNHTGSIGLSLSLYRLYLVDITRENTLCDSNVNKLRDYD